MTTITAIVTVCSELLTASIESVTESTGLSQAFLGIIVLPIAGNACEHLTAVMVAMKNKMDLAIGVALGSSIQVRAGPRAAAVLLGAACERSGLFRVAIQQCYGLQQCGHYSW